MYDEDALKNQGSPHMKIDLSHESELEESDEEGPGETRDSEDDQYHKQPNNIIEQERKNELWLRALLGADGVTYQYERKDGLRVLHINAQSLSANRDAVRYLVAMIRPHVGHKKQEVSPGG